MVATLFEYCFQSNSYGVHPPRLTPFYVNILIVQTNRSVELYKKSENDKVKPKWVLIYEWQCFHLLIFFAQTQVYTYYNYIMSNSVFAFAFQVLTLVLQQ